MGLLIYLDDLKGSSVVVRESANSFKDKLAKAISDDWHRLAKENLDAKDGCLPDPHILTLQGWHKLPLVITRPLERIIYFIEQPDRELQEIMDHHAEVKKQRMDQMKNPRLIGPN